MSDGVVQIIKIIQISAVLFFLLPLNAHAYMDPGTGSLVLQMLIAGIVGITVGAKMYWKKIISFFTKKKDE